LKQALNAYANKNVSSEQALRWMGAIDLWDDQMWEALATRHLQLARETAALTELLFALSALSAAYTFAGEPAKAASLIDPNWGLVELIVAAFRSGKTERAADALHRLSAMTHASGTDWALGIEARSRALLSDGDTAERLYLEAIGRLGRTRIRVELARAHLLCGEWLRRERWRLDAREQLRAAHEMFTGMGAAAFADRAALALLATAGRARKRTVETPGRPDPAGGSDRAAGPRGALQTRDRRAAVHQPVHRRIPPPQGLQQARHQLAKPTRPCPARATKRGRVVRAGSAVKWGSLRPCGTSVAVP
jgi:hypothetical protein